MAQEFEPHLGEQVKGAKAKALTEKTKSKQPASPPPRQPPPKPKRETKPPLKLELTPLFAIDFPPRQVPNSLQSPCIPSRGVNSSEASAPTSASPCSIDDKSHEGAKESAQSNRRRTPPHNSSSPLSTPKNNAKRHTTAQLSELSPFKQRPKVNDLVTAYEKIAQVNEQLSPIRFLRRGSSPKIKEADAMKIWRHQKIHPSPDSLHIEAVREPMSQGSTASPSTSRPNVGTENKKDPKRKGNEHPTYFHNDTRDPFPRFYWNKVNHYNLPNNANTDVPPITK
ncbi:hypothetical protein Aperf_G00000039104 [Anoplocephala perfoliata]